MNFVRKISIGGLLAALVAAPMLVPSTAQAWWARPGWGGLRGNASAGTGGRSPCVARFARTSG